MLSDLKALTALVLAGGVALAVVVLAVGAAVTHGPISTEESTLLSTVLGAAVGALATFLGLARANGHEPDEEEHPALPPRPPPPGR
jgi:hypothetical protein